MDKKVSIYANWKYTTFDRVLVRRNNMDFWEPGFYSRTVTLPDGSVGYLLVGSRKVYREIVPYTDRTAELVGIVALAPTFSDTDVEGWTSRREPWFVVGTPVLCSDYLPGETGWDEGVFGIAQYFSHDDDAYPFYVLREDGARNYLDDGGVIVDFSPVPYRYVKKLDMADLTPEQRMIYEVWRDKAYGPSSSPSEE